MLELERFNSVLSETAILQITGCESQQVRKRLRIILEYRLPCLRRSKITATIAKLVDIQGQGLHLESSAGAVDDAFVLGPYPACHVFKNANQVDLRLEILCFLGQQMLGLEMRKLRQGKLTPEAVVQLVPIPTCSHQRFRVSLVVSAARAKVNALGELDILTRPVPCQKVALDGHAGFKTVSAFLQVDAIHARGKVGLPSFQSQHLYWLRRIQKHVAVGTIELRQLSHTYGHLWDARRALAQESIRSEPRSHSLLLHILAKTNIDGVMVFRYIPVDVVETTVAHLDVDFCAEYKTQEPNKDRYHCCAGATSKKAHEAATDHPTGDVPVGRASPLIFGLDTPFQHRKELVSVPICKETPDAHHQIVHVERHDVGTCEDTLLVDL